jgi:hypothetical protein
MEQVKVPPPDNTSKKILFWVIIGLLAIGVISSLIQCWPKLDAKEVKAVVDMRDDTIRYYKGKYNTEVAEKDQVYADLQVMEAAYLHDMDSLANRLNLSKDDRKHITSAASIGTVTTGIVSVPLGPATKDTVHDTVLVCRDFADTTHQWYRIWGKVCDDSLHLNYEVFDSLSLVSGDWNKKWFLGKRLRTTKAFSYNPNVHIKGLTSLEVKEEKPGRLGIGPFAGLALMPGNNWLMPVVGVSVHYSLIRL